MNPAQSIINILLALIILHQLLSLADSLAGASYTNSYEPCDEGYDGVTFVCWYVMY